MLLTITNERPPATDLGYLLHKSPERLHSFSLAYGKAQVFYPEATHERCTFALLLDIDLVGLVRNRRGPRGEAGALEQYVNDRPYVASSFLSVALSRVLGTAMAGRSKGRPQLVNEELVERVSSHRIQFGPRRWQAMPHNQCSWVWALRMNSRDNSRNKVTRLSGRVSAELEISRSSAGFPTQVRRTDCNSDLRRVLTIDKSRYHFLSGCRTI